LIKRDGSKVVIEPKPVAGLEGRLSRWAKDTFEMKVKVFSEHAQGKAEKAAEGLSWMSREYARRKLGLR